MPNRIEVAGKIWSFPQTESFFQIVKAVHGPGFIVPAHNDPIGRDHDLVILPTFEISSTSGEVFAPPGYNHLLAGCPVGKRGFLFHAQFDLHGLCEVGMERLSRFARRAPRAGVNHQGPALVRNDHFVGTGLGSGISPA